VKTETKYGWTVKGSDVAFGPFDSAEAALEDAQLSIDVTAMIELGTVRYPKPEHYIDKGLEIVLEDMEQRAFDNDFAFCEGDPIFKPREGAGKALEKCLKNWARTWIEDTGVWVLEATQTVLIHGTSSQDNLN
jgi:hypothetical protein